MTERYLSIKDLMLLLKLGRSSIYRRIADGTLPEPITIGGLRRFKESDLVAALHRLERDRLTQN